jgi:hypothetical protein
MVLEPAAYRRWRRSHRSRRKPRAALLQGRMGLAAAFRRAVELSFFFCTRCLCHQVLLLMRAQKLDKVLTRDTRE